MSDTATIIDILNDYEQTHQDHGDPTNPHNIWEDVIYWLPGYDDDATRALPGSDGSDRFAAAGVLYTYHEGEWR